MKTLVAVALCLVACSSPSPAPAGHQDPDQTLACPAAKCSKAYPYCCGGGCWDAECEP